MSGVILGGRVFDSGLRLEEVERLKLLRDFLVPVDFERDLRDPMGLFEDFGMGWLAGVWPETLTDVETFGVLEDSVLKDSVTFFNVRVVVDKNEVAIVVSVSRCGFFD